MNYSPEIIRKTFKNLPEDLREAITSVDNLDLIEKIGTASHVRQDQVQTLQEEVGLVLLGLTKLPAVKDALKARLRTSEETTMVLEREITEKIFQPVRESLEKLQHTIPGRETVPSSSNPSGEIKDKAHAEIPEKLDKPPLNLPTGDIAETKLGGPFIMPLEEKKISPQNPQVPIPRYADTENKEDWKKDRVDPYREPLQ